MKPFENLQLLNYRVLFKKEVLSNKVMQAKYNWQQ